MAKKKKTLKAKIAQAAVLYLLQKRIVGKEKEKVVQRVSQGKAAKAAIVSPERVLYKALGGRKTAKMNKKIISAGLSAAENSKGQIENITATAAGGRSLAGKAGAAVWTLAKAAVRKKNKSV